MKKGKETIGNPGNTALQELTTLSNKHKRERYKSVPKHALPVVKYEDVTASGLTRAVIAWLELNGHKAWRQSSEGRYRPGKMITDVIGRVRQMKGQYFRGTNKGHSDISSIIEGKFVGWEVKIGKDAQSDKQKQFQDEVEKAGGGYFIIHSFDEFMQLYKQQIHNG
jgi:hypothetical protein